MSKYFIGFVMVISAISLAIAGAYGLSVLINKSTSTPGFGFGGMGIMSGRMMGYNDSPVGGERLSINEAISRAENYVAATNSDLIVAEVMSFAQNFYIVVVEKESGRAAFELLMDPYTGDLSYEPGPNMMWNQKYGHMGFLRNNSDENPVTPEKARQLAQEALDAKIPNATVEHDGFNFYGYYTFDYKVGGVMNGMLSIHGSNGRVWFHTWHGTFIEEKEVNE